MTGMIVVVTGGTGSFGNAFIRRVLDTRINEVRIFSRDEKKQDDMRKLYLDSRLKFYLGDVRSLDSLDEVMQGADVVFHAAAIKQVPSAEFFPMEAVLTNIVGSHNVIKTAIKHKVKKVVCLSTDKAAYPINAMGISKAMMERVAISLSRASVGVTDIIITRYGNVIGSRGSVIPLFISQCESSALTITDINMTRFIMSLDDAIDLVIYAISKGVNGDLFVKKSRGAKIIDIAHTVMKLMNSSCEIKVLGARHSEKFHETLLTREESLRSIDEGQFFRVPIDARDLNYDKYDLPINSKQVEEFSSNCSNLLSQEELLDMLLNNKEIQDILKSTR